MTEFYEIQPYTTGIERLDLREPAEDWTHARDLVQGDLAALDATVCAGMPTAAVRFGSNRDGAGRLFVYRVYKAPSTGIDPVVVGVTAKPGPLGSVETFRVSGDIAGEMLGDVLFEVAPRDVMGREAMTETMRDAAETLARQGHTVLTALQDASRQE